MPDMYGKTVVVTGGNSGIGYQTALALSAMGARVIVTARNADKGRAAVAAMNDTVDGQAAVQLVVFDLANLASVRRGAAEILELAPRLDVLVNNAGLIQTLRSETVDGFETTFAVNHLGPFLLTNLLLDRLGQSTPARIVNVASTAHSAARHGMPFDDLQSTRRYRAMRVYGQSKLANILFTLELSRRLVGLGRDGQLAPSGHRAHRVRCRRRCPRVPGLRHQDRGTVLPLGGQGGPHVGLPGLLARGRRRQRPVLRQVQGPSAQALGAGPRGRSPPVAGE